MQGPDNFNLSVIPSLGSTSTLSSRHRSHIFRQHRDFSKVISLQDDDSDSDSDVPPMKPPSSIESSLIHTCSLGIPIKGWSLISNSVYIVAHQPLAYNELRLPELIDHPQ